MLRRELEYFFGAVRFFTRLPVPAWVGHSAEALNRSARYFCAVGLLVGGLGAAVFLGAAYFWPQPVAVLLSMAATIYATGAFHEDGLADMVDGLGGGWDKARILEIMKDSRVGSYGVIVIVLALLGKFALLVSLPAGEVAVALIAGMRHLWMDTHHKQVSKDFGRQTAAVVLTLTLSLTAILGAKLFGLY